MATAGTFYHMQGLTLNVGAVDFREASKSHVDAGRHYVGLSRFRNLDDVFILDPAFEEIRVSHKVLAEMARLRSKAPVLPCIPYVPIAADVHDGLHIAVHNIRSYMPHMDDIFADPNFI